MFGVVSAGWCRPWFWCELRCLWSPGHGCPVSRFASSGRAWNGGGPAVRRIAKTAAGFAKTAKIEARGRAGRPPSRRGEKLNQVERQPRLRILFGNMWETTDNNPICDSQFSPDRARPARRRKTAPGEMRAARLNRREDRCPLGGVGCRATRAQSVRDPQKRPSLRSNSDGCDPCPLPSLKSQPSELDTRLGTRYRF